MQSFNSRVSETYKFDSICLHPLNQAEAENAIKLQKKCTMVSSSSITSFSDEVVEVRMHKCDLMFV
jgi:hypothetical protein